MSAYDLNGKVALVTGGARGIGYETALQLHQRGASVAVLDLDAQQARGSAERIGERTLGIGADVTDAGAMMAAVAETVERFGGLDIAMANAGIAPEGATARTMPPEEWERVVDVDLMGVWHTVRAALPQISERQGQLVLVASVAAFMPGTMLSPYSVAKAGVEQLGRALRTELAPFGASATVCYFGWIDTEMVRDALDRQTGGERIQELFPKWFFKRLTVDVAGRAIADGIQERAPRVFAPRWWAQVSALRGLINPLLDKRAAADARVGAAIRAAEEEKVGTTGAPAGAPVTPYDLSGKVALVTGAARGIGFATASQLHMRGASVTVLDLDAQQARESAERVGERTLGIAADVTDAGAMMASVAETVERFGGLDVVVANAGVPPRVTTTRAMSPEEWERVVDVNLMGVWHTVRAALPQVSERGGQVVLLGSILSYANGFLASPYAVAKAGVEQLGRALNAELAPFGASATVVYGGWIDNELVRDALESQGGEEWLLETTPKFMMKRITPDEAGAAIARGIEQRAPRVFTPRFPWRYFSALRGLVNPLLDKRAERDPKVAKVIREAESAAAVR